MKKSYRCFGNTDTAPHLIRNNKYKNTDDADWIDKHEFSSSLQANPFIRYSKVVLADL
jgi:hypothetical protein